MISNNPNSYSPETIPHPGETILDYLESFGWTQKELALRIELTPKTVSEMCSGKAPISPTTALAFEKVFQRPAHFWLGLQRLYDEYVARGAAHSRTLSWGDWTKKFPIKEMDRYRYFDTFDKSADPTAILLNFFGVSSPSAWQSLWKSNSVAFRQTSKVQVEQEAVSAWVQATEIFARRLENEVEVGEFDAKRLKEAIPQIRRETRRKAEKAILAVQEICAAVGILFVLVPELSKTGISGCARWLTETKAIIALTLRHKRDDIFWFTFFHELGHVILHRKIYRFVLDNAFESLTDRVIDIPMAALEEEANRFAADTLIDPNALFDFILRGEFTGSALEKFAKEQEIAPGIVVGQLQHLSIIPRNQGNNFKQTLNWTL